MPGNGQLTINNARQGDFGTYECTVQIGQQFETAKVPLVKINVGSGHGSGDSEELTILDDFITEPEGTDSTIDPACLDAVTLCKGKIVLIEQCV